MGDPRNDRKGKSKVVSSSSADSKELQSLNQRSEECNVEQQRGEWDDPMAVELQKLLIPLNVPSSSCAAPVSEKDAMIVSLMQRKQQLEKEVQGWIDWTNLKGNLQAKIDKARKRQSEFEALWQHEEREKTKLLQKLETLRRERQEMKEKAKMEEDKLRAKAEENRVKYEEQMNKLSVLKLAAVWGGLKRESECVVCLTKAKTVVFLPCAHQVICTACNVIHGRQGMKDCPVCRTRIMKRIQPRFVPPKPH